MRINPKLTYNGITPLIVIVAICIVIAAVIAFAVPVEKTGVRVHVSSQNRLERKLEAIERSCEAR